jgi:ABC-2 type transport system ATP-binding protein
VFGLVSLDGGEVRWDGRPIGLAERLRFGYMPEERGLYPRMRAVDQLSYIGRLHGLDARAARVAALDWLERLGLADRAETRIEALSHGNQQRVQLAAALVHRPELLVLDEPFAGLDPVAVRTLAGVLRGEAARGAAVLFSSHQLDLVEDICKDVAIIDHGRIVANGDLSGLRGASQRRRIELQLEGAPPAWLPGVAGVELLDRENGSVQLLANRDVDPERVLAEAERSGRVVEFRYGPPSLAELFLELVGR